MHLHAAAEGAMNSVRVPPIKGADAVTRIDPANIANSIGFNCCCFPARASKSSTVCWKKTRQ